MRHWEALGQSSSWQTPAYVFDALGETFDLDVAAPRDGGLHVPARDHLWKDSLELPWSGYVWMNPPFGGRNGLVPWLAKFIGHGNGIALTPDRTSAPWWQDAAAQMDAVLFIAGKIKFIRDDGTVGKWPSTGTTLMAKGERAATALRRSVESGLGLVLTRPTP